MTEQEILKKWNNRLTYVIFRFFIFCFWLMPFWMLYLFSDFLYYWFYYITGYRKKIVFENLRNSFPSKQETEIRKIAKGFYHHLVDIVLEGMKAFTIKEKDILGRYHLLHMEFLDELYRKNQSVICVAGHYNNWEWGGVVSGILVSHRPIGFYKPLSNPYIDRYTIRSRAKGRAVLASILHTAETFRKRWGGPCVFYMVADQSPSSPRFAQWVTFLNQKTATLHGPEKYARLHNLPVYFSKVRKIKRGHYELEFVLLSDTPGMTEPGEITERFMNELEKLIMEAPQYYLWSHRRWKIKP